MMIENQKKGVQTCPICGKPMVEKFKPFCSSRCSMVDLGSWLGENYRLKSEENDEEKEGFSDPSVEK